MPGAPARLLTRRGAATQERAGVCGGWRVEGHYAFRYDDASFPPWTAMSKPAKAQGAPSFESAVSELESIVARMEGGELTLEESLAAYKRGAELLKVCQTALKDAQQQVKVLEAGTLQQFTGDDAD